MKIYAVGGSVRDELLGLPVKDRDYVVVGATPEEMEQAGFKPVGKDFPVFLHPSTHEEYALARTERKTARGYKGFTVSAAPDVTLEEDLKRRDLTINAMARDATGGLVDPFGGERDLRAGVLRHVSEAFVEDPVRLLRVARFAGRFGFAIAPETMQLLRELVANGEIDALVPERVWQELATGLMERAPLAMLDVLDQTGATAHVVPQWVPVEHERVRRALGQAATAGAPLPVRFALLWCGLPVDQVDAGSDRLRAPTDCRELAVLVARVGPTALRSRDLDATALVDLLRDTDAYRRRDRFEQFLAAVGYCGYDAPAFDAERIRRAAAAATSVDAGAIARAHAGDVANALRSARIVQVASALR
ncbi:MAG: multifunctional CCA tRNA nucleotidyl transferase/2'3'-cyclic phosphodiesterase/2'nucleotidase/phosphatase [Burkholderiales bacterium]